MKILSGIGRRQQFLRFQAGPQRRDHRPPVHALRRHDLHGGHVRRPAADDHDGEAGRGCPVALGPTPTGHWNWTVTPPGGGPHVPDLGDPGVFPGDADRHLPRALRGRALSNASFKDGVVAFDVTRDHKGKPTPSRTRGRSRATPLPARSRYPPSTGARRARSPGRRPARTDQALRLRHFSSGRLAIADQGELAQDERAQPPEGGLGEPVAVEPDSQHVGPEPAPAGHDVAEDGEAHEAALPLIAEREVRSHKLPQGDAKLGADSRGAGRRLSNCSVGKAKRAHAVRGPRRALLPALRDVTHAAYG